MDAAGKRIKINNKRSLGYLEYGPPGGIPILLFPGSPNSRLIPLPEQSSFPKDIRLIIPERPGFGLSDYQPKRTLLSWPEDITAFTDALEINRCAVLGISAGGPYALACAYKIPERITKAGIIAGVGPIDIPGAREELPRIRRIGVFVATYFPWLLRPLLWLVSNPQHNPENFFNKMLSGNSEEDIRFLMQPEIKEQLIKHYCEATRRGIRGFAREAVILSHPWGFKLEDINIPVYLWHGEDDKNVSMSAVRYMKEKLRDCHATLYPHQGHWLFHHYWAEIVNALR